MPDVPGDRSNPFPVAEARHFDKLSETVSALNRTMVRAAEREQKMIERAALAAVREEQMMELGKLQLDAFRELKQEISGLREDLLDLRQTLGQERRSTRRVSEGVG